MAGDGIWKSINDGDLERGDACPVLKETTENPTADKTLSKSFSDSQTWVKRSLPSAAQMIPRTDANAINYEAGNSKAAGEKNKQQSLPISIPEWSKLREKKWKKSYKARDFNDVDEDYEYDGNVFTLDSDEDDELFDEKLPPHEIIARRNARRQISSFSVFEGVGRTLKGRDLTLVRNAVHRKTGFLETGCF